VFVLPVRLAMVSDNPVRISGRLLATMSSSDVSMEVVVEAIEETFSKVHISDGVNAFGEFYRARNLAEAGSPVVFDSFHVHLVDDNNDFVTFGLLNLGEEVFVTLINENFFELREENIGGLDVPVHHVGVNAFLREGRRSNKSKLVSVVKHLISVTRVLVSVALHKIVR